MRLSPLLLATVVGLRSSGSTAFSRTMSRAADAVTTPVNRGAVEGLAPAALWRNFAAIASIPRPSKKEEKVLDFLKAFATERELAWDQDPTGNLVIKAPGRNGGENADPVVLQGHVDMVCEKNADTSFDFDADAIQFLRTQDENGEWLTAQGTTLGADNGIGCATILALLEDEEAVLPPLECLFTIDEETGLTGAQGFDPNLITGTTLLNLDTEEFGSVYVGCAGGGDSELFLDDLAREPVPAGFTAKTFKVSGLLGGHSGLNIHEGRGNALLLVAGCVRQLCGAAPTLRVSSFVGGDKHNALCREALATLHFDPKDEATVSNLCETAAAAARAEFGLLEKNLSFELLDPTDATPSALTGAAAARLIATILALPHGVIKMSAAMADLVETSNNLASVRVGPEDETARVLLNTRSSVPEALDAARERLAAVADLAGGRLDLGVAYPGWNPNMASPVLEVARQAFRELINKDPEVIAIHAGLECGLLGDKKPGLDMVSLGPSITGAHSPDEQVLIGTVGPFYEAVKIMLRDLARKSA